ncbi:MAG: MFS transporter, partial [Actinomycetia bacterium]|nr:MFS transporter [Actinomycetes bacterium]
HFGAAFGAATLTFGMGLFIGPQLGGYLADLTDSFKPSFVVVVGCAIVGVVIGLRQPGRREETP